VLLWATSVRGVLAQAEAKNGNPARAEALCRENLAAARTVAELQPRDRSVLEKMANAYFALARRRRDLGHLQGAVEVIQELIRETDRYAAIGASEPDLTRMRAYANDQLSELTPQPDASRHEELARTAYRELCSDEFATVVDFQAFANYLVHRCKSASFEESLGVHDEALARFPGHVWFLESRERLLSQVEAPNPRKSARAAD
jgi:hypothetical protein